MPCASDGASSDRSVIGFDDFRTLALGLAVEAEGLDAAERLAAIPAVVAVCNKVNAANTYGDFLQASACPAAAVLIRR
jgi:hypothetical protein